MARVTVEDCVLKIPNRFDLVMLAAQRARDVASGASLTLERDNDKNPVVALREIADESVDIEGLAESLIRGRQKHVEVDEPEEDIAEFDVPRVEGAEAMGDELAGLAADAFGDNEVEEGDVEEGELEEGEEGEDEEPPEGGEDEPES